VVGRGASRRLLALVKSDLAVDTEVALPGRGLHLVWLRGQPGGWVLAVQVRAQVVPLWSRPSVIIRRRLRAAARWCSQWSLLVTPR
jgi:hypothetical protein